MNCFTVFIDLDQANFFGLSPVIKGNSSMYSTSITTSGKLDWRQNAFLICKFCNGSSTDDYYKIPPDFIAFLSHLLNKVKTSDRPSFTKFRTVWLKLELSQVVARL